MGVILTFALGSSTHAQMAAACCLVKCHSMTVGRSDVTRERLSLIILLCLPVTTYNIMCVCVCVYVLLRR